MVDEVITKQELIDAQKDAQSLDDFINGGDEQIVVTRLLKEYPTLANAIRQIYEKGGKFYPTLAAANADIANIRTDVYVITGDNGAYYKATSGATSLTKSPYDPLEAAKLDATTKANAAEANAKADATAKANTAKSEAIIAAATDATTKANAAQANAIATAATDATTKTNAAKTEAIATAKGYTDAITNINLFRGIAAHAGQYSAATFDKTTLKADYAPTEIRYKGMNVTGGFAVPFNGELRSKLQVWVKVKSAALNSGTNMRFLVQAVRQDNTTFLGIYSNIADGTTGWVKLAEAALNEADRALFKHVNIQPHVTGGAELIVEDFYIGEGIPTSPFVRVNEPKNTTIARTAERRSVLPHWSSLPVIDGVSYNENGDIVIQAGKAFVVTLPVESVQRLYYCGYLDQMSAGDCRFSWSGYRKGLTTFHNVPYFPCSTGGNEFSLAVVFDAVIDQVQLTINNYSATDVVTLRSFEVCYDPVAVNGKIKVGDRFDQSELKSDVEQAISDAAEQAKADTAAKTNINLFRGIAAHIPQYSAVTFDKTTLKADYAPTEIRYSGLVATGGFIVPFNGELRSNLAVWVKVKSAALNAGTNMRFLVQAVKQDSSTFLSAYGNIADGATGWVKLAEVALSEANRALFKHVNIQPHVTDGAELIVEDFYIGESNPTSAFVRVPEPKELTIARNAERKNILPHWTKMPEFDGVSYNENGDITIQTGKMLTLDLTVSDLNNVYYCGYLDQENTGDCRFQWTGYPTDLSSAHVRYYFLCSTQGNEFSLSYSPPKTVNRVRLEIINYGTSAITLRSFELCYDPVAVNSKTKIGDRFDESKLKSEIIKSVTSQKPAKNFSSFPDWSVVAKSADGKRYAVGGEVYNEPVALGNIETGKTYYISLPDSVATLGTGTARLTVYHAKADGTSLGGVNANITSSGVKNVSITTTAETARLSFLITLTGDAKVELGRLIISEVPYSDDLVFEDLFKEDQTGMMLSDWEYPTLSGFTKWGDQSAEYPITVDAEGDRVLSIPVTETSEIYGQGAKYIVEMPVDNVDGKSVALTFQAKSSYAVTNPTKFWLRYFREGSSGELGASLRPITINRDGSWTLNQVIIPSTYNGYAIKYVEIFLLTDNTSVVPLQLKRFIQTVGSHNPFVKFFKYASEKAASGLTDYLRLKDALAEQPQNVFSVGRQLFRPLKTVQDTVADYELINGQSLLPKRLNNIRHIDSEGFKILHVDFDDNVYIRKGNALYKTTVDDLNSRCVASTTVGTEKRGVFNSSDLPLVNASAPSGWLRITGDGTLVIVNKETAHYSTDGGVTWLTATGYQDVQGIHYNAWGTDCVDNIVITSGYKVASEGRGTGRVNFSSDNGKTYQVILDIATSSFIDNAQRNSMHIHSVKYDPYWEGVWVVMGDGAFNNPGSSVTSNLWFIEKPATPEQSMISFNTRGQDWLNEQHVSIFPLQDCLLLGADANPTALYRMARTKNPNALRDTAMFTHSALSHYGCGGYQHAPHLPATMYFGRDGAYTGTDAPHDIVYMTYDGVNVVEIYKEPVDAGLNPEKPNCFAYALDKHFVFDKRMDSRFSSGGTWIIGDIRYMR